MKFSRYFSAQTWRHASRWKLAAVLWAVAFLVFGLFTVAQYPPVNYNLGDEVWSMRSSLDAVDNGIPHELASPRLYFAAMGYYLSLAGRTVFAARSFSLVMAALVLYLTYVLGKEMLDERAGLLSSLVLGSTFAFTWHSHVARAEMLTSLFIVAAICLLYYALRNGKNRFVLYGTFLAALSVNVHPNNLQFALSIVPFYVLLFRRRALSISTLYFFGGLLAGFLCWLFIAYFPTRPVGLQAVQAMKGVAHVSPFPILNQDFFALFRNSLVSLFKDYLHYVRLYNVFFPNSIDFAFVGSAAAVVWAASMFTKRRWEVVLLLSFVLMTGFINYFITDKYGYWHMVEFFPFFALATVFGIIGLGEKLRNTRVRTAFISTAVLLFVISGTADTFAAMLKMRGHDYGRLLAKVSEKIDGRVLATGLYSPAFKKEDFVDTWFEIDRPYLNCLPIDKKVRELGIKYIIADDLLLSFAGIACGENYKNAIIRYLNVKCTLVARIDERYPNYWVDNKVISEIYVLKTPE